MLHGPALDHCKATPNYDSGNRSFQRFLSKAEARGFPDSPHTELYKQALLLQTHTSVFLPCPKAWYMHNYDLIIKSLRIIMFKKSLKRDNSYLKPREHHMELGGDVWPNAALSPDGVA